MINDLPLCLRHSNAFMFADDSNILITGKPEEIGTIVDKLEEDLNRLHEWLSANQINLNVDKSKVMFIGKASCLKKCTTLNVRINNTVLSRVKSIRIPGVYVDQDLSLDTHIKHITKKCYGALSFLNPLKHITSQKTRLILVNAYVLPIINYACIIYLSRGQANVFKKVDKILRSTARFVLNKRKYDSISQAMCNELKWLNCKNLFQFNTVCFAYKIMFRNYKGFFKNYLDFSSSSTRCTRNKLYRAPCNAPLTYWGECTFKTKSVSLWLKLPEIVRTKISSLNVFKSHVFKHLLDTQCDDLSSNDDCDYAIIMNECFENVISSRLY